MIRTSSSPPRSSHLLSSARCRTFCRNRRRRVSWASSRRLTRGLGRGLRVAKRNLLLLLLLLLTLVLVQGLVLALALLLPQLEYIGVDAEIGEDCVWRGRVLRVLGLHGESGGDGAIRIGEDDRGEETAGRWAWPRLRPKANDGGVEGITANMAGCRQVFSAVQVGFLAVPAKK